MNDLLADIAKLIIPGAIIAIISAVITVRLAISRFHEEKWWEKKAASYTNLFEILHRFKNYASQHYDRQIRPGQFSEEQMDALEKERQITNREYARLRDLASFYLSKEALVILKTYENQKSKARSEEDIFRRIEGDLEAVEECLKKLKEVARKDLKVR